MSEAGEFDLMGTRRKPRKSKKQGDQSKNQWRNIIIGGVIVAGGADTELVDTVTVAVTRWDGSREAALAAAPVDELERLYKESNARADEDPAWRASEIMILEIDCYYERSVENGIDPIHNELFVRTPGWIHTNNLFLDCFIIINHSR